MTEVSCCCDIRGISGEKYEQRGRDIPGEAWHECHLEEWRDHTHASSDVTVGTSDSDDSAVSGNERDENRQVENASEHG